MSSATSLDDAHLSVRRWATFVLGETLAGSPWIVLTQEQAVPDERRPQATAVAATPATPIQYRTSIPQGDVRLQQGFVVTVYPELADAGGTRLKPAEARRRATALASDLLSAVLVGLEADDETALCGPMDLPLWDYDGVDDPRSGPASETPYAFMTALSATSEPIPDPDDDRRWTVVLSVRLAWWRGGRSRAGGAEPPLAESMPGTWQQP